MEEAKQEPVVLTKELEVVSTALAEIDKISAGLAEMRQKYGSVVYDVTTSKGLAEAKAARSAVREPRYQVEHVRIAAKRKVIALGKTLDSEAERITGLIREIEDPIDAQITAEEDRKEQERLAEIEAENKRVAEIQARINNDIRSTVTMAAGRPSAEIATIIADVERLVIDESFQEFQSVAEEAKDAALGRLRLIHTAAVSHEEEQAKIQAERAELARLRAAEEERQLAEQARREEAERRCAEQRESDNRRLANIRREIAALRSGYVINAVASPDEILEQRHIYAAIRVEEHAFDELLPEAQEAHATGLRVLDDAYAAAVRRQEQEAEAARLAAQREELERIEADARAAREAEEARLAEQRAELERIETEQRLAREAEELRISAERAEIERQQEELRLAKELADARPTSKAEEQPRGAFIDIVFDGPPSHESGRFIEVEDASGESITIGQWIERSDGYNALRIPYPQFAPSSPVPPEFTERWAERACNQIDAGFFSADTFHDEDSLARIEWYLGRWLREIVSIKEMRAETAEAES